MTTTTRFSLILAAAAIVAGACTSTDATPEASEAPDPAPSRAPSAAGAEGLVAGTPPGGLEDWVSQVAEGMSGVNEQLGSDVQAAQRTALELYVTRQEYIEMYWGAQGRLGGAGTERLSELVLSAEDAFHDLLQKLSVEPVEGAEVRAITDSINARLGRVVAEAHASGVLLVPPGNPPVGAGGSRP